MLFKNDVPTSHRAWFVIAATFTVRALLEFRRGVSPDFVYRLLLVNPRLFVVSPSKMAGRWRWCRKTL